MEELTQQEIKDLKFHINQITTILDVSAEEVIDGMIDKCLLSEEEGGILLAKD